MIKNIFLCLLISATQGLLAQSNKMEVIKAERVAFMTDELSLSTEEAQVFWPVYNKYSKEMIDLKKSIRTLKKELKTSIIEDKGDAGKLFDEVLQKEIAEVELKKKYIKEFKKVLPENKAYKVFLAEEKFKRYLLKKLKDERR